MCVEHFFKIQIGNIFNIGKLVVNVPRGSLCLFFPFYLEPLTTCSLHPQCFLSSQSSTVLTTDAALTERALSYRWILPTSRQSGVVSPCASVLIAWLRLSPLPGLARISRGTVNPPGELLPGPLSHLSIAPPSSSKASLPPHHVAWLRSVLLSLESENEMQGFS